jgi:UDP-GlcNAc:undecaprenyl-phosphate GlcNAc-1-phosphate transferase
MFGSVGLVALGLLAIFPDAIAFRPVFFILFAVFLFLGLAASRSSFKILDQLSSQQARSREERVLIYGAGDAGEMALRWIQMNPQLGYRPVGFLDDDPYKAGRQIHGVEILGDLDRLEVILAAKHVDGVVVALDGSHIEPKITKILSITRTYGQWVRSLRLEFELLD